MLEREKALEIAEAKKLRGDIVETLYTLYPQETSVSTLRSMLRYMGVQSEASIKKALFYLEGKEYIGVDAAEVYENSRVHLTPLGINLAENDFNDVGGIIDE